MYTGCFLMLGIVNFHTRTIKREAIMLSFENQLYPSSHQLFTIHLCTAVTEHYSTQGNMLFTRIPPLDFQESVVLSLSIVLSKN